MYAKDTSLSFWGSVVLEKLEFQGEKLYQKKCVDRSVLFVSTNTSGKPLLLSEVQLNNHNPNKWLIAQLGSSVLEHIPVSADVEVLRSSDLRLDCETMNKHGPGRDLYLQSRRCYKVLPTWHFLLRRTKLSYKLCLETWTLTLTMWQGCCKNQTSIQTMFGGLNLNPQPFYKLFDEDFNGREKSSRRRQNQASQTRFLCKSYFFKLLRWWHIFDGIIYR